MNAAIGGLFHLGTAPVPVAAPAVLLVIGVHRGELAFGEAVAARLDPARFSLLRIPDGLSGHRPRPDERDAYRRLHEELYHQILRHLEPAHQLLIDLHTGIDETRRCADVLCADPALLAHVAAAGGGAADPPVRCLRLADAATPAPPHPDPAHPAPTHPAPWPVAHPDLPRRVWWQAHPRYVCVEVYLPEAGGSGTPADQVFAATLLTHIADWPPAGGSED